MWHLFSLARTLVTVKPRGNTGHPPREEEGVKTNKSWKIFLLLTMGGFLPCQPAEAKFIDPATVIWCDTPAETG
jgi:hypothetical protein